jgi:hypothetical protein
MLSTRYFSRNTLVVLSAAFATFSSSTAAALIDNGTTLTSNGIPYYSHGLPVATLNIEPSSLLESAATHGSDLIPMTIIHTDVQSFGLPDLNSTFSRFSSADDVFQKSFLHSVFLTYNGTGTFEPNVASCLGETSPFGTKLFLSELPGSGNSTKAALSKPLPNGPYFVSARTGQVFQAYRLYPDENLAFTQPSVSDHNGGHFPLTAVTENLMTRSVAVPSRLYYTATKEQPLAGLRLAVKDIFHIKGLKTSGGNRAYYYLYPERNATGPAVQRLLDQGAVLVGKTGTVQFANGDRVTADWVDVHCPFNPRGDGYQDPSGSSSGSGAAIGAYEWLDLAVGSDTGGSMRGPAGRQGIYGNRPSTGAVSLNNVIPLSPHLDTAGVFARSASLWSEATHAWYTNYTDDYPSYPKNVYYSTEGADPEDPAAKLVESFVSKLSGFLDTNYTISNISEQWAASRPTNVTSSINELLNETYAILTSNDQFNLLGRPFFSDYAAQHDGRRPFGKFQTRRTCSGDNS